MSVSALIGAVEVEGLRRGWVVAPAFGDLQVADVFDGRDGRGADSGQVGGPAPGTAGGGVLADRGVLMRPLAPAPTGLPAKPPVKLPVKPHGPPVPAAPSCKSPH